MCGTQEGYLAILRQATDPDSLKTRQHETAGLHSVTDLRPRLGRMRFLLAAAVRAEAYRHIPDPVLQLHLASKQPSCGTCIYVIL